MASNGNLIEIEDLTKIFYTDEVETHALSGIHLTIARGEYVAMSGPRAAASPRCSRFWACWTRRRAASICSTATRSRT
jgi:ABC-type dipeptide/oligopeptide/nickel transport system ATPase subunit